MTYVMRAIAAAVGALWAAGASGAVVDGLLTGGSALANGGGFIELDASVPITIGQDNFNTYNLYAFDEEQVVRLSTTVTVDIGAALLPGTIVSSHYVFYDPPNSPGSRALGYVDFDAAIVGIATSTANLRASDFLANTAVTYLSPGARGLESNDAVFIDPVDPNRLRVDFTATSPGDYVRVFTRLSPTAVIPLPAPVLALLAGLAALAGLRLRRRGTA